MKQAVANRKGRDGQQAALPTDWPPGAGGAGTQYLLGHSGLECSVKQGGPLRKDIGISSVSQEAKKARTKDGDFTR